MKKILSLMVAALAILALPSCMKEKFEGNNGDEATMTLNISMPDAAATKAYGDGMYDAKNVIIGVFDENGVEKFRKNFVWEKNVFQQEVTIQFVMGKTYQMVLWAQYGNAYGDPKSMPLDEITLDYKKSNREDLDAFYAYVEPFRVTKDFSKSITLKRPFAQLNFATTVGDMDESIAAGDLGIHNMAAVTIKNVANTLNLFTGEATYIDENQKAESAGKAVVIPETAFPKVDGKYPTIEVDGKTYEVISMNYVLVADAGSQDGKTTVDLELKVGELVIEVPGANMKRNWRTNVVGELLTGEGTFTVKIDPIFDGSYDNNWNEGSNNENENPDQPDQPEVVYSEWKLLGSHNAWSSEEFMVLEDGLAVARNVEFPATKAEGDGEFKVSNGTDWYGMAVAATVGADKYLAASKDNSANIFVAPGKYDIWFDAAKTTIYVMTPGKSIKEATEFKAPQPEEPETDTWGIVGTFNSWGGQDLAMTAVKIGEVEYWFADNFAVAADAEFKFRYTDGNWDDANVYGAAGAVAVDAASELMQPGNNISVAAGTYDIYLDVKNALVYVMTDGKTPADVAAPDRTDVEIYVVRAADWTNLYAWGALATGAWPGKSFQETVTINEVEYNKWTLSVASTTIGQEFQLIFNNGNGVQTADSDKFQVAEKMYFKVVDKAVVKIEAPVVEEPEPIVPAVALTLVSTETVPAEDGNVVVKVTSNVAWTLALDGTKVAEGAEAVTDFEVTVPVPANTTTEVVNHTLLLSDVPAEGAQAVTATKQFTQAAAQPVVPEEPEQPAGPKVVTVKEFLDAENDETIEYQVSGTISGIYQAYNSQYDNISIYITDQTGEMLAYRVSCEGITDPANTITKGDEITVKGTRTLYNETPQMAQGGVIVAHKDVVVEEPELPANAKVISFADKANRTVYTENQQVWEQNGITVINDKDQSTTKVGDYAAPARFYKSSKLTVQSKGMTKIVFDCPTNDNNKYFDPLKNVIKGCTVEGSNIIVTFTEPVDEFVVSLTAGQVRVNTITVYTE